jgi:hypothetical protein
MLLEETRQNEANYVRNSTLKKQAIYTGNEYLPVDIVIIFLNPQEIRRMLHFYIPFILIICRRKLMLRNLRFSRR